MANILQKRVIKIALVSRLISLAAQSAFDNLITDYDSSVEHCSSAGQIINAGHHRESNNSNNWNSFADQTVLSLVGGNSKWDALYFLDIARNGYQYEQNMAFFPLLPFLVHLLGTILNPIQEYSRLHDKTSMILAATVINLTAFVLAALGLFCLTKRVFHDQKLAYMTALFFCFNPASVFFSAAYSESVFAMTQFWGMYYMENDAPSYLSTAVLLALGSATRSNGMVSIGFIAYKILTDMLRTSCGKFKVDRRWTLYGTLLLKASQMLLLVSIIALPFVAFQYYGFMLFCRSAITPPWCKYSLVPLPYSYMQKQYWNVGFLKYYELKQLPNFLLAMPVILMGVLGIFEWLKNQTWSDLFQEIVSPTRRVTGILSSNVFVYVVHLSFLLIFGMTSMHVQVVTRFVVSSSPMIYWFAAGWTMPRKCDKHDATMYSNLKSNLVYIYFLVYFWLGFVLHCNFYPWT